MKFAQLTDKFALEAQAIENDVKALGLEYSTESSSLLAYNRLNDEINIGIESINLAYQDLTTLRDIENLVNAKKVSGPALEACTVATATMCRKYSVAMEGVGSAIVSAIKAVFKAIADSLKWIAEKIAGMFKKGEDKVASNATSIAKSTEEIDKSLNTKGVELPKDFNGGTIMQQGGKVKLLIKNIRHVFAITPDDKGLALVTKDMVKIARGAEDLLKQLGDLSRGTLRLVKGFGKDGVNANRILEDKAAYFETVDKLLRQSGFLSVRKHQNSGGSEYYIDTHLKISKTIVSRRDPSGAIDVYPETRDTRLDWSEEYTVVDYEAIKDLGKNIDATYPEKEMTSVGKLYEDLAKEYEATSKTLSENTGFVDSENSTAGGINVYFKQQLNLFNGISSMVKDAAYAVTVLSSQLNDSLSKARNSLKSKGVATESADISSNDDEVDAESRNSALEYLENISTEASLDLEYAIEAIDNNQRLVYTDHMVYSLEGFYEHVKNKYSHLGISLEEDPKPEQPATSEEKKPDDKAETKPEGEKKEESADNKDSKSDSGDGFMAKVKGFFKAIIDFFVKIFKTIKEKLMALFGADSEKDSKLAAKAESNAKAVEELSKNLEDDKKMEELSKKIVENKNDYPEDVVTYHTRGELTLPIKSTRFSLGEEATVKDIHKLVSDLSTAMSKSPGLVNKLIEDSSNLTEAIKTAISTGKMTYDDLLPARSKLLKESREAILSFSNVDVNSEGNENIVILKLGETYVGVNNQEFGSLGQHGKLKFTRKEGSKFKNPTVYKLKKGESVSIKEISDVVMKDLPKMSDDYIKQLGVLSSAQEELKDLLEDFEKTGKVDKEGMGLAKQAVDYIISLSSSIGVLYTYIKGYIEYVLFIHKTILDGEKHLASGKGHGKSEDDGKDKSKEQSSEKDDKGSK